MMDEIPTTAPNAPAPSTATQPTPVHRAAEALDGGLQLGQIALESADALLNLGASAGRAALRGASECLDALGELGGF